MTSDEVIERAETAAINAVVSRWGSDGVAMMEVAKVAAKAAIAVLPPAGVGEWQPIESAPKDGTEVLVAGGTRSHPDSTGGPEQFSGVSIARWSGSISLRSTEALRASVHPGNDPARKGSPE